MSTFCHGNGDSHCCYVNGKTCIFLQENTVEGRRWACGLYVELGDWNTVINDNRYIANIRPAWVQIELSNNLSENSFNCHPWGPGTNQCCYKEE